MTEQNDNVIDFDGVTRLDLSPDRVLEKAKGKLEGVVTMGYTKEGDIYFASSYSDGGTVLWLMESCKKMLLEIDDIE